MAGQVMAIEFGSDAGEGPRRIRALQAAVRRDGTLCVHRSVELDTPPECNAADALSVGRWIGVELKHAGFSRCKATIAIGREHVAMKLMSLPTIEDAELPEMTRLTMQRELPFDAEAAVIDFVPVQRTENATTVLAIAARKSVIDFGIIAAKAAGFSIERVALRASGAAALAATPSPGEATPEAQSENDPTPVESTLMIDILSERVEFSVIAAGAIRYSRAADVVGPHDRLSLVEQVVTESRRTWMSCVGGAISGGNGQHLRAPTRAMVIGDRRVAEYAAQPLEEMLGIPVHPFSGTPAIENEAGDLNDHWPLAGLLLENVSGGELINFANPRRAPDLAAQRRQRRLMIAGAALLLSLFVWTMARQNLQGLQRNSRELEQARAAELPGMARYSRDVYQLEHLKRWESTGVDWLTHASSLAAMAASSAGGPDRLVLDSWAGTLVSPRVQFDGKTRKWSITAPLSIAVEGEARDRETADRYRDALVQNNAYRTETTGSEGRGGRRMPFGFRYQLVSNAVSARPQPESNSASPAQAQARAAAPSGDKP